MMRGITLVAFLIFVAPLPAHAKDEPTVEDYGTKILVTFADPGMTNATRAGPSGPGYRRRSSAYLVSIGVKRAANRIADEFNLVTLDEWPIVSLKVHCLVFGVAPDVQVEALLTDLRKRPEVESAQLVNEFELSGTAAITAVDSFAGLQHHHDILELPQAHNWSLGDGTSITIVDTGADFEHPELKTQIVDHHNFVSESQDYFTDDVHGTAIAGVIGAAAEDGAGMTGIAPSARLTVLKACWHSQDRPQAICDSFSLAKALAHANGSGTDIINLSLSGPSDALLGRLVRQALDLGIVVVAAAPRQKRSGFPVEIPGVIVVGSNDEAIAGNGIRRISISAPGNDILVPVPRGGYDYASGSSLSAAQVSGIVALLVARDPELDVEQINNLLVSSRPAIDESVNACRALAELLQQSGCRHRESVSRRR
jgi:subtilisin family serine protease